jgi:hypothetical protein
MRILPPTIKKLSDKLEYWANVGTLLVFSAAPKGNTQA